MELINILFIGDIIGKPGLTFVQTWLPGMIQKYKADVVIANGENVADGKGILPKDGEILFN
ncbi:MAG: YmdB family metallophosphoesterase, partial [Ignavibacteria bacterium]|nr:YmdB family metallophosphoesterase [Ignavibacteria bacterium]